VDLNGSTGGGSGGGVEAQKKKKVSGACFEGSGTEGAALIWVTWVKMKKGSKNGQHNT